MTTPNQRHQSGHATAFIKEELFAYGSDLFVTLGDNTIVTFDKGTMVVQTIQPGVQYDNKDAFVSWGHDMADTIVDIFKAVGKALDIYSDEPSQAYKQGYAEGEAKVLREWNRSLRGEPDVDHFTFEAAMAAPAPQPKQPELPLGYAPYYPTAP